MINESVQDGETFFRTTDMAVASYLKMMGYDLWSLETQPEIVSQFVFVFRVEATDPDLMRHLDDWNNTPRGREMNQLMLCSKKIKAEIAEAKKRLGIPQYVGKKPDSHY